MTVPQSASTAHKLKEQGNQAFVKKNFQEADSLYSQALEEKEIDKLHLIYGNRSAARFNLGRLEEALDDANKAISNDPKWAKGYYRKASALEALFKFRESQRAFEQSAKLDSLTKPLKTRIEKVKKKADSEERQMTLTSPKDWRYVYSNLSDTRDRLGFMVHLWNKTSQQVRYAVFLRLLQILAGNDAKINISDWTAEKMVSLPDSNYEDINLPDKWFTYYDSVPLKVKVELFEISYSTLSRTEQNVVVNDMKFHLQRESNVDYDQYE